MVAAQWGESRDPDARTGGVAGRFRLLGGGGAGAGDAPDTGPPEFGTAAWGYRRSEVDAWASWVAGLVAHGRNETIRADSAEATLRATLQRLEQLERPQSGTGGIGTPPPPDPAGTDGTGADSAPDAGRRSDTGSIGDDAPGRAGSGGDRRGTSATDGTTPTAGGNGIGGHPADGSPTGDDPAGSDPTRSDPDSDDRAGRDQAGGDPTRGEGAGGDQATGGDTAVDGPTSGAHDRTGRAHDRPAEDGDGDPALLRATAGAGSGPPTAPGSGGSGGSAGPAASRQRVGPGGPAPDGRPRFAPSDLPRRVSRGGAAGPEEAGVPQETPPADHDLARLHVVETTLHEVMALLRDLSDRGRATGHRPPGR